MPSNQGRVTPLLLPPPPTEITPEDFIVNAFCSTIGHDFIIFEDKTPGVSRFVQFAFGNPFMFDFPVCELQDNGLYLNRVVILLERLGFSKSFDLRPMQYSFNFCETQKILSLQANCTTNTRMATLLPEAVFELFFESDIRRAKVTIGDWGSTDEITSPL